MELNEENDKTKASFLLKLLAILNEPGNEEYIKWSEDGKFFIIYCKNLNAFADNILPKHFKHHTFSSFHRQLNLYNFHKEPNDKIGEIHFRNDKFKKGISVEEIKRIKKTKKIKKKSKKQNKKLKKVNSVEVGVEENEFENFKYSDEYAQIQKIEDIIQKLNHPNKMLFTFLFDKMKETNEKLEKQDNLIKELYTINTDYEEQLKIINNTLNNNINNNNNNLQPRIDSISLGNCFDPNINHLNENNDSKYPFFILNGGVNNSNCNKNNNI